MVYHYLPSVWGLMRIRIPNHGWLDRDIPLQAPKDRYKLGRAVDPNDVVFSTDAIGWLISCSVKHVLADMINQIKNTFPCIVPVTLTGTRYTGQKATPTLSPEQALTCLLAWPYLNSLSQVDGTLLLKDQTRQIVEGSSITLTDGADPYNSDLSPSLGTGGFGQVYEATEIKTRKAYAVKRLPKIPFLPARRRNAPILREIWLMMQLRHSSASSVLVMEKVEYGDLEGLIQLHDPMSEDTSKLVVADLCDALEYLHSHRIVHRDIKPGVGYPFCQLQAIIRLDNFYFQNILVSNLDPIRVKLADFGLAKLIHEGTYAGTICGTPMFMAPEVSARDAPIGHRLSRRSPFKNRGRGVPQENGQDLHFVKHQSPIFRRLPHAVTPGARDVLSKLLLIDPSKRLTVASLMHHEWIEQTWEHRHALTLTHQSEDPTYSVSLGAQSELGDP
ncbi:kinase-like protein [Coniophora puteana RWD-64-598 SS2]|uniref:non-specific serine/threonine protein kinase n=1 Tax=Coniophora puteana (strain RWD-64-598) TaxID=741705 RepID=A0A5M3MEJ7_CONPW|nr:kinase-like protein [Coniophora puteana RWD-64-598 SS2]EIW77573.1 kinase-like protein [Coniophora puteana RWD-64-598 SS2]